MDDKRNSLRAQGATPTVYGTTTMANIRQAAPPSQQRLRRAGILPEFHEATAGLITHPGNSKLLNAVMANVVDFVNDGTGLMILGDPGAGKTMIAAIVGMEVMRHNFSVLVKSHSELQEMQFNDRPDTEGQSIKQRLLAVDLLILDGLNDNFLSDSKFGPLNLEDLIARRNGDKKSTLLTSRVQPDTLKNKYKTLFSVMQGTMIGMLVTGDDFRRKQAADRKRKLGVD